MSNKRQQPREQPATTESDLIVFELRKLAVYDDSAPGVTVLADVGAARVVLFAFRPGQVLKEHETTSQILVQALRGRVQFNAAGRTVAMSGGMLVQLEARVRHSIVAQTDALVLVTIVPSPTLHSTEPEASTQHKPLVSRVRAE